ncbi:DUF4180 domain-containing protein [Deinococcus sp. VB142]|uniref:DUF4180 domain-containing protein n=1 Tax=Deinococcus sp. VB142 TaxID=3112952 RepID=A0AAU6Q095_9DEIO
MPKFLDRFSLRSAADIPDLIGAAYGYDAVLLTADDLAPEYLDLRTGLLGELFQKVTNYRLSLALVLPDADAYGPRFSELALEHRSHPLIRFFGDEAAARAWLARV